MAGLEQIQNRAQWACNSHTLPLFDIAFAEISSVKNQNFRDSAVASKMFGDCHVQLRGHDIGEFVKTESCVVTVCAFQKLLDDSATNRYQSIRSGRSAVGKSASR
jgi:hypothetical protein